MRRHTGTAVAAAVAGAILSGVSASSGAGAAQVYRARTDVVVIDASVMDGRKPVTTLTKDDFELRDNGVVQQILDFDRQKLPLDVTVTLDVSGSMTPAKRAIVERSVAQVSAALNADDRGAVVVFAARVAEMTPLRHPPLTLNLLARGGTALIDALLLSLVRAPEPERRQLSLFMTDGEDTSSYFDVMTVVETAKYSSGQTSIVLVRDSGDLEDGLALTMFRSVASTTGGEMIVLEKGDDLSQAFLTAIENFRTSYLLRYTPTGVAAPGWHDVTVRVKSRQHTVRARRGYWGTGLFSTVSR